MEYGKVFRMLLNISAYGLQVTFLGYLWRSILKKKHCVKPWSVSQWNLKAIWNRSFNNFFMSHLAQSHGKRKPFILEIKDKNHYMKIVYNFSFKTADLSKDRWSAESNSQASKRLMLLSNTVPKLSVTASQNFTLIHSSILLTTHYA